jgi:hypothetical protein
VLRRERVPVVEAVRSFLLALGTGDEVFQNAADLTVYQDAGVYSVVVSNRFGTTNLSATLSVFGLNMVGGQSHPGAPDPELGWKAAPGAAASDSALLRVKNRVEPLAEVFRRSRCSFE